MFYYKIFKKKQKVSKILYLGEKIDSVTDSFLDIESRSYPSNLCYNKDIDDGDYYAMIPLRLRANLRSYIVAGFENELPKEVFDCIGDDLIITL